MPEEETEQLRDIVAPDAFIPNVGTSPMLWVITLVVLAAIAAAVWSLLLKNKVAPTVDREKQLYKSALKQIEHTSNLFETEKLNEIATKLSLTIREYISSITQDPTLFETHEEFAMRHEALVQFPDSTKQHTRLYFDKLSQSKYGPTHNDPSAAKNLCVEAKKLLDTLHETRITIDS